MTVTLALSQEKEKVHYSPETDPVWRQACCLVHVRMTRCCTREGKGP